MVQSSLHFLVVVGFLAAAIAYTLTAAECALKGTPAADPLIKAALAWAATWVVREA